MISYGLQCRPLSAIWKDIPGAKCLNVDVVATTNRVNAVLACLIDFTTAAVPAFLLHGVQMKPRTKFTLHMIFCFGIVTAGLSIGRAVTITKESFAVDSTCKSSL